VAPAATMSSFVTAQQLLERYVQAKDLTRPALMQEIYAPDAVLTYSIATDSISFPNRTIGRERITNTLVIDFAIAVVPWLVLMRETAASCLRAGKGCYRWTFARDDGGGPRVVAMHIHIERMEPIADPGADLMRALHTVLPYPWLAPSVLRAQCETLMASDARFAFLLDLNAPLDAQACDARLRAAPQAA
jgi:hypothetical protein